VEAEAVSTAVKYSHLVGKYIRMQRPATIVELDAGDGPMVGMEANVVEVEDKPHGCVQIIGDDGNTFLITPQDEHRWQFIIWVDEAARQKYGAWGR